MNELRLGRVSVSGSVLMGLALICWLGQGEILPAFLLSGGIHEAGHMLAAWRLEVPIDAFRLSLSGAELRLGGLRRRWVDGVILLAGPLGNVAEAMICTQLHCPLLAGTAVILGGLNLLPVEPLDGGGMLRLAAEGVLSPLGADRLCRWTGGLLSVGICILGVVILGDWQGSPALAVFGGWLAVEQWKGRSPTGL